LARTKRQRTGRFLRAFFAGLKTKSGATGDKKAPETSGVISGVL
jgi:hypothetical protein